MDNQDKDNIFQIVKSKASIVDVIAFYLGSKEVIHKGNKYVCRCPFHDDHSPSMMIDPNRQSFKCFVDGHGGDAIGFVQQYEHVSALEALKKVASICHIELPSSIKEFKKAIPKIEQDFPKELEALKATDEIYRLNLISNEGKLAREYLQNRKITKDVIEHFSIGFAPSDSSSLITKLRENKGFDVKTLETAGILSSGGQLVDRYENRIMFPIQDNDGHIVAFSGRKINNDQPGGKYINYSETPLFKKSEIMYHFYKAKEEAKKVGYIYLVEGYMDVIAYVRAGIISVAGLMGTALTPNHIDTLKRLGVEVRLALDSDEPGRLGIERAIPELFKTGLPMRMQWAFKNAKDADELLTKFGKDEFLRQVNRLYDPVIFLLGRKVSSSGVLNDSKEVLNFLESITSYYLALDPLSQDKDLKILAEKTGFDSSSILEVFRKGKNEFELKKREKEDAEQEKKIVRHIRRSSNFGNRVYEPDFLNISLYKFGCKYNQLSAYEEIENRIIEFCKKKDFLFPLNNILPYSGKNTFVDYMKKLCEVEARLIVVLSQRRSAYSIFEATNSSFVIHPLYVLNSILGSFYLTHNQLEILEKKDYESIVNSLMDSDAAKADEKASDHLDDTSDLFDMSDDETIQNNDSASTLSEFEDLFDVDDIIQEAKGEETFDGSQLESDEKDLLIRILSLVSSISDPLFDAGKFDQDIKSHQRLVDIYHFLKNVSEEKGGTMSNQDYTKYLSYIIEFQKI